MKKLMVYKNNALVFEKVFESHKLLSAWVEDRLNMVQFGNPSDYEIKMEDYEKPVEEKMKEEMPCTADCVEALMKFHEGDESSIKDVLNLRKEIRKKYGKE